MAGMCKRHRRQARHKGQQRNDDFHGAHNVQNLDLCFPHSIRKKQWSRFGEPLPPDRLPGRPCQHVHQLCDLLSLLRLVAAGDRVLNTMTNVIFQHSLLNPPQRCAHSRNLGDDIDAIALLSDHLGDAAHLPFDFA